MFSGIKTMPCSTFLRKALPLFTQRMVSKPATSTVPQRSPFKLSLSEYTQVSCDEESKFQQAFPESLGTVLQLSCATTLWGSTSSSYSFCAIPMHTTGASKSAGYSRRGAHQKIGLSPFQKGWVWLILSELSSPMEGSKHAVLLCRAHRYW